MKTLILHGWGGSDYPHWQAHLAMEIAKNYGTVSFPLIQHPHFPSLNRWRREVLKYLADFRPDTVVCHSLANTLWLHLAATEKLEPIQHLYMIAPPSLTTVIEGLDDFYPTPLPGHLYANEVHLIASDNDPYITTEEATHLAKHFRATLTIIKNAGHINVESGYGKWKWIENQILGDKHHA